MANATPFERILEAEWLRNAKQLAILRALGVGGWFLLCLAFMAFGSERFPEWAGEVWYVGAYAAIAFVTWIFRDRIDRIRGIAQWLIFFVDMPMVFLAQRAAILALSHTDGRGVDDPVAVAAFTCSIFLVMLIPAPSGVSRLPIFVGATVGFLLSSALMWSAGIHHPTPIVSFAAVFVFGAGVAIHIA